MVKFLLRLLLVIIGIIVILAVNLFIFSHNAQKITEGVPIENPDTGKVALLVIDIQEGTTGKVSATEGYVEQSDAFISRVNEVIEAADARGDAVIYIKSEVVNPLINIINNTLARGSEGAELDNRLLIKPGPVVTKRKNDPFRDTDLDQILTSEGIGKLVLVGLDAGQCVHSAFLAARNRGYRVSVISDAVLAENEELRKEALDTFREEGVELIPVH
jgi:nicotinamidase-related amidase